MFPFEAGIGITPLLRGHSEHRHIKHIGFVGVNDACLGLCNFGRYKIVLDGIRMDPVVYFGKLSFGSPSYQFLLLFLQTLEFLDNINLELRAYPHRELKCDVLMGIRASIASGFCPYGYSIGPGYKFLYTYLETVQSRLISNYANSP